jgi:hypothetical protein
VLGRSLIANAPTRAGVRPAKAREQLAQPDIRPAPQKAAHAHPECQMIAYPSDRGTISLGNSHKCGALSTIKLGLVTIECLRHHITQ